MKQIRKRLTYANVMSSIAVFLVLGGATALAAGLAKNSVGSKQLKKNAVTTAKIKNNAVNGAKVKDGSLSGTDINLGTLGTVPSAKSAETATSATNATNAATAESVFAFARVEENGTIVPEMAKNLSSGNVTNPVTGTYCFDLPFVPRGVQVTNEVDSDNDEVVSAVLEQSPDGLINCPAGTEAEVSMFDVGTPGAENGDFYIELYK